MAGARAEERNALVRQRDEKAGALASLNERIAGALVAVKGNGLREDPALAEHIARLQASPDGKQTALTEGAVLEAKAGRTDEVDRELAAAGTRLDRLKAQTAELHRHGDRYRKILDNKERILSFVEEEGQSKARLSDIQSGIDEAQRTTSAVTESLKTLSELEAQATRMRSAILLKEKARESDLKRAADRLEAARKVSGLIEEVPCRAEGDFASCRLLTQAVEAKDSLPALLAEADRLSQPLALPEGADLAAIETKIAAVDRVSLQNESRCAAEKLRDLLRMGEVKKRPIVVEAGGEDTIAIHPMMYMALSYDHRIIDGATGNGFLFRVGKYLQAAELEL